MMKQGFIRVTPRKSKSMKWKGVLLVVIVLTALSATNVLARPNTSGVVYVASNEVAGNNVLVFSRSANGELAFSESFPTGGLGTGTGLGNQGGLILSADDNWLFVVNAGSNEVSLFEVRPNGLKRTDKVASGGKLPISLAFDRDVLYVLNAGGAAGAEDNITAFTLTRRGKLVALRDSTRHLSASNTGPAQVSFDLRGSRLVVTEKSTNTIDVFTVNRDGYATGPELHPSSGITPFGFAFGKRNRLFISEAFGGAANASALSSYELKRDGKLELVSPSVPTNQTAACWTVVTGDGRFAYVTNTGSGTISGYSIGFDAKLSLLQEDGLSAITGAGPIDAGISNNDRFLFTLNGGNHTITGFRIGHDGDLAPVSLAHGLPVGSNGLAAR